MSLPYSTKSRNFTSSFWLPFLFFTTLNFLFEYTRIEIVFLNYLVSKFNLENSSVYSLFHLLFIHSINSKFTKLTAQEKVSLVENEVLSVQVKLRVYSTHKWKPRGKLLMEDKKECWILWPWRIANRCQGEKCLN